MHRSIINKGPVITILTQSQHSSKHIQTFLQSFFQTKVVPLSIPTSSASSASSSSSEGTDALNGIFHPMLKYKFNSHASICEASNTILHFLSIDPSNDNDDGVGVGVGVGQGGNHNANSNDAMTILAITPGPSPAVVGGVSAVSVEQCTEHILSTRNAILNQIQSQSQSQNQTSLGTKLAFIKYWNYRSILPRDVLTLHSNNLPFLDLNLVPVPLSSSSSSSSSTSLEPSVLNKTNDDEKEERNKFQLREIVLPFFDSTTYANGKSMLQLFSSSSLHRPKTGLYQWELNGNNTTTSNNQKESNKKSNTNTNATQRSIVFRPLPSPSIDMNLPPVTFVYQCNTLDDAKDQLVQLQNEESDDRIRLTKVGFNGYQNNGQLRIEGSANNNIKKGKGNSSNSSNINSNKGNIGVLPSPSSLEFRYCDAKELSSTFAEAHESLLAGSLDDLQNVNVMVEGSTSPSSSSTSTSSTPNNGESGSNKKIETRLDTMNGLGDCWVEFRANMKQPSGFFKKNPNSNMIMNTINNEGSTNSIRQWLSAVIQGFMGNRNNGTKNGRSGRIAKAPDIPYE